MSKKEKDYDWFHLARFIFSLIVLLVLAIFDLREHAESVPNLVYLLLGGLNGVDAYKLYNDTKKDYDKDGKE